MENRVFDKARLPSRHVTEGPKRAPHRSYLYAMGLTREQIHQPLVGVASCWNEAAPCNISLMRQAQAVKKGVASASGTPREFCTITVTDGIAMGHRGDEILACLARSHRRFGRAYHARPLLRCAGRRRRLRQVAAGHDDGHAASQRALDFHLRGFDPARELSSGRQVTVQDLFEAVGQYSVGDMSAEDLGRRSRRLPVRPAGACGAQFTANTMATVSEAIGLALPYSAGAPAPYEIRDRVLPWRGEMVMELLVRPQYPSARHRHPQGFRKCR